MGEEQKIESNTVVYAEGGHVYRLYNGSDIVDEYHLGTYASEELAQAAGFESGYSDIEVRPEVIKH